MMRTLARWFLVSVLALDVAVAAIWFAGGGTSIRAEAPATPAASEDAAPALDGSTDRWTRAGLETLGQRLEAHSAELERRERELDELLRGAEVLRRAGLLPDDAGAAAGAAPAAAETPPAEAPPTRDAFQRLQRAYENMEPESAAQALAQLAGRDKDAVVELLLGWPPRTSGAILDALTQADPALAADLSYEIWRRDGGKG